MDNVQNCDIYVNKQSSQIYRSYLCFKSWRNTFLHPFWQIWVSSRPQGSILFEIRFLRDFQVSTTVPKMLAFRYITTEILWKL
jgi:hypothetical protein